MRWKIFFSVLRGFSFRFNKLNCIQVQGVFETVLMNSFTSKHSVGANCQADSANILAALNNFLEYEEPQNCQPDYYEGDEKEHPPRENIKMTKWSFTVHRADAIVFARQILFSNDIKNCKECHIIFL